MSEKKKFLLRLDEDLYEALEKWAADDLRSVNAEIEFLLTDAVKKAGRTKQQAASQKAKPGGR
ncbi:MAG: Arc family DNA-binding protein [Ignavibacteriae bacterium]|nr:Arc family DNA-binding protein [Ignavibacteriota bacterium]